MGSRRMLGLFLLVVLATLCVQPCGSDDPELSDNKADEGGIFSFTLSSPFLFWSDDEYEVNDNVFVENTASQGKGDKDNTDDNHGDKSQVKDKEESGKEEDKQTDDERGDAAVSVLKELDDDDEDEVAQMDQLIDVDERFKGQRRLFKRASDDKDAAGSRKMLRDAAHNDSVALQDSFLCPQTPDMQQLSYYMDTCHNCLVQTDKHSCPLHEAALELKKQMTELQELLSYGCRMGCSSMTVGAATTPT
ncbi:histone H2A.Z-specific chaperone CHZ1-like [Pomacea canaliculata]|uniref:histone H2A.Z-specific chaperone CHZ1-like n=1 Tax=Pomacea canaliculata TaxID=400727 RepID=UPI000D737890|nr:histone H2A.Z-specific chaperone CHZ1-like [Pomacea canaliculata]